MLTEFEVALRNLLLQHSKTARDAAQALRRVVAAHPGCGPAEPEPTSTTTTTTTGPVLAADDPPEGPGN